MLKKNEAKGILQFFLLKSWVNPLKTESKWRLFKNDTFYNLKKAYFLSRI